METDAFSKKKKRLAYIKISPQKISKLKSLIINREPIL